MGFWTHCSLCLVFLFPPLGLATLCSHTVSLCRVRDVHTNPVTPVPSAQHSGWHKVSMPIVKWTQKWQGAQEGMFHLGAQLTALKENSPVIMLLPHIFLLGNRLRDGERLAHSQAGTELGCEPRPAWLQRLPVLVVGVI